MGKKEGRGRKEREVKDKGEESRGRQKCGDGEREDDGKGQRYRGG